MSTLLCAELTKMYWTMMVTSDVNIVVCRTDQDVLDDDGDI